MSDNHQQKRTNPGEPTIEAAGSDSSKHEDTHPICQDAADPEICEEFAERLQQAFDNIDPRSVDDR